MIFGLLCKSLNSIRTAKTNGKKRKGSLEDIWNIILAKNDNENAKALTNKSN